MKKYLYSALALPLLFACSTEEIEKPVVNNDQFAGIEKVDATFSMDEGAITRFDAGDGSWVTEEGDLWGFAWMGGGESALTIDGNAWQNHNLIQTGGIFKPQTNIYLGNYYIYRPYDKTTVNIGAIKFKSLEEQPLAEGYESTKQPWKNLGKTAINIGDKWTNVIAAGNTYTGDPLTYNKPGTQQHYKIYAALFSNQTGLDLTYQKNNPKFTADKRVQGATDIDQTYTAGTEVGSAAITELTIDLDGAAKSFTYAPTAEPSATHSGTYWADKSNLGAGQGFTFTDDVVTLKPADDVNGVSTGADGSKGWFWFNSLPVTAGNGALGTAVQAVLTTSYGVVTVNSTVGACAWAFDKYNATATSPEWIQLAGADAAATPTTPATWNLAGAHNTFINQYGNHKGKYALTVDFSTGVMNNMHIKNDTHLQTLLKYYIASGKNEVVTLNLDGASATDKTFKLSKISIALLQTINASGVKVLVQPCTTHNNPVKIIVTQDGSAGKTEVPDLNNVFKTATDVYLAAGTDWTWKQRTGLNQLTIDANVASLTNEGTLTVNADNIDLSIAGKTITNAAGATMNITKVTTAKTALNNFGTINVGAAGNTAAELRAYGIAITNDATSLTAQGVINNYGVVGVTAGTGGFFYNYGKIDMKNDNAITLLTSNETAGANFAATWAAGNKMGTVVLPDNNPTAIVSVSNATNTGFIKYTLPAGTTTYRTPTGNVKFNTIVVSEDITFNATENEIQFIEFNGTRTQVVNPAAGNLPNLKGVILNAGKSIIIEKGNTINCTVGAYLGTGATVYRGGIFNYVSTTNYFGNWSTDQIIEY